MRGQLLGYDQTRGEGIISTEDGTRYRFAVGEWRAQLAGVRAGIGVDFESSEPGIARDVYPISGSSGSASQGGQYEKSPIAAGLLAFFLGGLGVHKFYLGYNAEGVILLIGTIVSWILLFVVIGIFGLMAIGIICLIETILYISKSPEEFNQTYVIGRKPWF